MTADISGHIWTPAAHSTSRNLGSKAQLRILLTASFLASGQSAAEAFLELCNTSLLAVGWIVPRPKRYVQVLTSNICERDFTWT